MKFKKATKRSLIKKKLKKRVKKPSNLKSRFTGTFKLVTKYVPSFQQLFPDILRTRMRNFYSQTWNCPASNLTSNVVASAVYGNALHQPIASAQTGATPLSFNTATNIVGLGAIIGSGGVNTNYPYQDYLIYGASIIIKIQPDTTLYTGNVQTGVITNQPAPGVFVCFPTLEEVNLGNVNTFAQQIFQEYPQAKNVYIGGSSDTKQYILKNRATTGKLYGLNSKTSFEADNAYYGGQGVNPTNSWAFVLAYFPTSSCSLPTSLRLDVEVIYDIQFSGRNLMATGAL